VYHELGHGFLESVYREALMVALNQKGLTSEREKAVEISFRSAVVGVFRTDLVVNDTVILELKTARTIDSAHEGQLLNYLKATKYEVGLLFNFGPRPQFRRLRLDNDYKTPQSYAAVALGKTQV
jgi:GxxExxY protein